MYHHKDRNPASTIRNIKKILSRLNIKTTLQQTESASGKTYAYRLYIGDPGLNIGVNGKGISPALAQASAYGELMERLQNQFSGTLPTIKKVFPSHKNKNDFTFDYAPDEKYLPFAQAFKGLPSNILKHFFPQGRPRHHLSRTFKDVARSSMKNGKHICLPFYSLKNKKLYYIPLVFRRIHSNGLCAGNTPYEAISQGISEILERHALSEIFFKKITPPNIPNEYLRKHCPQEWALMKNIEKRQPVRFIVKDCSLNKRLPVICLIMINKNKNGYHVHFGSHPVLSIALERTLTETFQGRDLRNYSYVPFRFPHNWTDQTEQKHQWCTHFKTTLGSFDASLFASSPSYPFQEKALPPILKSTQDHLTYLCSILQKLNWDLLIRDTSFLGIPAYSLIIPETTLPCYATCPKRPEMDPYHIQPLLHSLRSCSRREIKRIIKSFEHRPYKTQNFFSSSLNASLLDTLKMKIFDRLLPAGLYYKLNQPGKAAAYIQKTIASLTSSGQDIPPILACASDFLSMTQQKVGRTEILSILGTFYNPDTLLITQDFFLNDMKYFQEFSHLPCPDCSACGARSSCKNFSMKDVHKTIKTALSQNRIDQRRLKDVFSGVYNSQHKKLAPSSS